MSTQPAYKYDCLRCAEYVEPRHEGYDALCPTCGDVCARVRMCDGAGCSREAMHNEEFCVSHIADQCAADPAHFNTLLMTTAREVGRELARRCGIWLLRKQAA